VDNKPLNRASVSTIRGQLVDNKPFNKTGMTTTRCSTSGQQTP